ncbi:MAG: SDR family oxidoreductase [Pseudomonadota bacterium]
MAASRNTALITGASSGIGREFAKIHAQLGGDLVLVARRLEKLNELKSEIEGKYNTSVHVISDDLSDEAAPRRIVTSIETLEHPIEILINNAGYGGQGLFYERPWSEDRDMIQVNVIGLAALTRLLLPGMIARGSGKILNVSSTAGELPGPLQAVYFASKAFVTSFSYALAEELSGTGVTVTALLPGATDTEFAKTSGLESSPLFQKTASAESVAELGYAAMVKGELNVVAGVPFTRRIIYALAPLLPKKAILRAVRRTQEV